MEIEFGDEDLRRIYADPAYNGGLDRVIVRAFRKRAMSIRAAADQRDLGKVRGNRFEKLKGRDNEYSVRLNQQWRLILSFKTQGGEQIAILQRIEDCH